MCKLLVVGTYVSFSNRRNKVQKYIITVLRLDFFKNKKTG